MMEGLHISPGLGTPWDPSGRAGGLCWAGVSLGFPTQPNATVTRPQGVENGWMEYLERQGGFSYTHTCHLTPKLPSVILLRLWK